MSARLRYMTKAFILCGLLFIGIFMPVKADIYTCKHADGSTELTDSPCAKSATVVSVLRSAPKASTLVTGAGSINATDGTKIVPKQTSSASSSTRPVLMARVEPNVQKNRDDIRRRVLSNELESEEKSLSDLRVQYNAGNPPLQSDEQPNSSKYLDRRARLLQTVSLHEKNVAAIRQELSNLR
jgi:hypothetical protein